MPARGTLFVFVVLAACRPPPAAQGSEAVAISVTDAGVAQPTPEQDPISLSAPSDVACTFAPKELQLSVAFDGEGPSFGSVISASGTLAVATGPASRGAFLEHAADGVHLRGYVSDAGLDLYVKKPVSFGGWLLPRGWTILHWVSGKQGALELRLHAELSDGRATMVTFHEAPRAFVACADVALAQEQDDLDTTSFVLRGRKGSEQHVRPGELIPLSRKPGEAPVGEIQFSYPDTAEVTVLERRGPHAFVMIDAWEPATLYGWMPDTFFAPPPNRLVGGRHVRAPTIRQGVTVLKVRRRVVCDARVRILAEVAGRRAWVGEIDPGTPFVFIVDDRTERFRDLELESAYALEPARLVAERTVLEACKSGADLR